MIGELMDKMDIGDFEPSTWEYDFINSLADRDMPLTTNQAIILEELYNREED